MIQGFCFTHPHSTGSCEKPTELYSIIEHFANGRRRLELFGEDHNIRRGWLTVGSDLSSNNHDSQTWRSYFEGQRTSHNFEGEPPTVISNHLLGTTPTIEALRPKSPTQVRCDGSRIEQERRNTLSRLLFPSHSCEKKLSVVRSWRGSGLKQPNARCILHSITLY